ncbi:hypothetical protein OIV83_003576 [Microbotryomycetes sp. JL201]|nr:hypothetical protein OIV83_003576 [Microbotryomycetes sp. JL201]
MVETSSSNYSCANTSSSSTAPTAQAEGPAAEEPGIGGPTYPQHQDTPHPSHSPGSDTTAAPKSRDSARGPEHRHTALERIQIKLSNHDAGNVDNNDTNVDSKHTPQRTASLPNMVRSTVGRHDNKAAGLDAQVDTLDTFQAAKIKRIQSWRLAQPATRIIPAEKSLIDNQLGNSPTGAFAVAVGAPPGTQTPGGPNAPRAPLGKRLLEPTVPVGKPPGWKASIKATVNYSWLNVLLVMVPVSWAMEFSGQSATVTFVTAALAIVPCAALLSFATEELAMRVGDAFGGLLNASFGNAVELIIAILALVKGELKIVQSAMLGSILSNSLLVLGCCYLAGGIRFHEQGYGIRAAQTNINMLGLSVAAIVIPVGYHEFVDSSGTQSIQTTDSDVLNLSRGIAILLLVTYVLYLLFQLWTHAYLYVPVSDDGTRAVILPAADGRPEPPTEGRVFRIPSWGSSSSGSSRASSLREPSIHERTSQHEGEGEHRVYTTAGGAGDTDLEKADSSSDSRSKDKHDSNSPRTSVWFSVALLVVITAITGVTAEALVGAIDGLASTGSISKEFIGLILLPLVGNAAEHVTAVTVAAKNKLDLSMSVAIGSSIQVALFILPLLILIAWGLDKPLTLYFDPFPTLVLFLAVCSVNWATADGRTNWLEGAALVILYVLIALVFFYYPGHAS